jgi:hypothetical protein
MRAFYIASKKQELSTLAYSENKSEQVIEKLFRLLDKLL